MAGVLGVASVSVVPFALAVAGRPSVVGFPAVASVPANPGVPILSDGFTHWTVQRDILLDYRTIGLWLSDFYFFLLSDYRNIEYQISEFKKLSDLGLNLSDYRISDLGLNLSDYQISDLGLNLSDIGLGTSGYTTFLLYLWREGFHVRVG